jgi:integrase/recombinase XerD
VLLGPEGKRKLRLRTLSNDQLIELYDSELVLRLHNVKNLSDTRKILARLKEHLGNYPPSAELAKSFLAQYANRQPRTLYRYAQMVKAFMKWYGEPLTDVLIKIPKSLPSYTEDVDIEKLLDAIGDKMIPLTADMANRLHAFVKDHKPGQSVFGLGAPRISMKVKQFAKKAGLTKMHTHALRHKFAQDLLESGVDIKAVQAMLGHKNLNTTEVYLSLTDQRLHDAIKKREQYKTAGQALNKVPDGESVNKVPTGLVSKPEGHDPSLYPLEKTLITSRDEQNPYVETPHKQQIRESAKTLMSQIDFPFIGDRIKESLTLNLKPTPRQLKRNRFTGNVLLEGLRSHLQTGGYSKVLQDIADFDKEDTDNLVSCRRFIDLIRKEVEKNYQVSIPITDNGEKGFTISFVQTVCADAIERARGTNHYKDFRYHFEGLNLKFGAYVIYAGVPGQDLKPYEDIHRDMRENCFSRKQPQDIADQIRNIGEIQVAIRQQLETFTLLERVPGKCILCSTPKDTA